MISRLEIRLKNGVMDAEGRSIKHKAGDYFGIDTAAIHVIKVLTVEAGLDPEKLEELREKIFTNPVIEESSFKTMVRDFDWLIWVGFRPGVRDTAGSTAVEAIEDLFKIRFSENEGVYTSKLYEIKGELNRQQAEKIAGELLANDIIQQWKVFSQGDWDPNEGIGLPVPKVILDHVPQVRPISISSDQELEEISHRRNLALHPRDIPVIRQYFLKREDIPQDRAEHGLDLPTDVELEYIS